jgi:hypothetical protein
MIDLSLSLMMPMIEAMAGRADKHSLQTNNRVE